MNKPKLFTNMGDVEAQRQRRLDRAKAVTEYIQRERPDMQDVPGLEDMVLGLIEEQPFFWLKHQIAAEIHRIIGESSIAP